MPSQLKLYSIINSTVQIKAKFPKIYNEMGEFKDEIELKIKSDAKLFVQSAPTSVPIPLLQKVEKKLLRLISLDIISHVTEPTDWVAPMVVFTKGEEIRLCCDYTELNESVLRSHFPRSTLRTNRTRSS